MATNNRGVLSLLSQAQQIASKKESKPNADKLALNLPGSGYQNKSAPKTTKVRAEEQARLNIEADAAQKKYEDYLKTATNLIHQKNWGRQDATADELMRAATAAKQARDNHANESKIQNAVDLAYGLKDNKAIQSEVDKQRAVNLGTSKPGDTLGQKGLPFLRNATTEAQRQQKMGYSTWDTEKYQAMTDDEAEVYNRLAKNGYEKEAQEFLDAIDSGLNYRVTEARTNAAKAAAQDGFIGGAAASAGSTLLNVLGTGAQAEWAAIRAARSGEAIDQYSEEMYGRNLSTALRSTVSEEVGKWAATLPTVDTSLGVQSGKFKAMPIERQQESNRKIAEFLYNTGMSMVDMVAMSPMGATGMSIMMGTNSAADALIDAKNRGLSDNQAMAASVIAGVAEIAAEKFSLDRLFNGKVSVSALKSALVQGGVEASEEAVTELANTLADIFIAGDQSMVQAAINGYIEQGFDYQQAQNKAFVDVLADIAAAGAGGFLSGFTMGGAVDIVNTNAQGRSVIDQTAQTFIKQGQTPEQAQQSAIDYLKEELRAVGALADEGTVAYELSQRAGDMSIGDIGRAYLANREQIQNIVSSGKATTAQEKTVPEQPAQEANTDIETPEQTEPVMTEQEIAEIESIIQREKERLSQMPYQNSAAATRRREKIAALERVIEPFKARNLDTMTVVHDTINGGEGNESRQTVPGGLGGKGTWPWQERGRGRGESFILGREIEVSEQRTFQQCVDANPEFGDPRKAKLLDSVELPPEKYAAMQSFKAITGCDISLYDPGMDSYIYGYGKDGYVYCNINADVPLDILAGHEWAHANPDITERIKNAIGVLPPEIIEQFNQSGRSGDPQIELACNSVGSIFYAVRTGEMPSDSLNLGLTQQMIDAVGVEIERMAKEGIINIPGITLASGSLEQLQRQRSELPVNTPKRISDLKKQYEDLPMQDSREGIEIRRKINDLLAEMEAEAPQTGGTDVQDNIGGNEPIPDEVKNSIKDKKPQQRRHEALKKRLNVDERILKTLETFVREDVPMEDAVAAMMSKVDPQIAADYYKSYKALTDDNNAAVKYRKEVLNRRYQTIKNAVGDTLWKWKDKKTGLAYSRMTQERIIREIAKEDPETAAWVEENIFQPVHVNEAARTRWANQYAERAKAHNMTEAENKFVHVLITERDLNQRLMDAENKPGKRPEREIQQMEAALDKVRRDKADLIAADPSLDETRCNAIANDFLAMYREIYEKLTGIQLKNGMHVTDYRSTYAPLIKEDKTGKNVASYLGVELKTKDIPTNIVGLTEFYKPGKPWFSHDLSRSPGYSTSYDMLGGLDEYLKSSGDVIFHTDDIQNVRMFESVIREATTPEGRAETVKDWIDAGITGEELNAKLQNEQLEGTSLSNYVRNLQEYGNLLANKKSAFDRGFENLLGRGIYRTMQNVKGRITANVLGGNISVVLSQAIPLTQATSVVSYKNLARGFMEAGQAFGKDDGFNDKSTFLTNRIGYKNVAFKDAPEKLAEAISKPFEFVDQVVSAAIVRGRYYDNIAKGMSEAAAMREADTMAASLIADRSKGALPTIFGSKNPISTMLTAFQVESNNQMDFLFKDLKIEAEKIAPKAAGAAMALMLARAFIAAFGYDELRKSVGLSANAFDPINFFRDASEEIRKGIDEEQSISQTVGNIVEDVKEQIPFIGGGRYGSIYENALPKFGNIADAVQAADEMEENAGKYVAQAALEELSKPVLYLGLPTGGAQLKKTAQGINALVQGESKAISKKGEEYVQYTVAPTLGNIVGGVLLGKSGLKENKEWKASGFTSFSDRERDSYSSLKTHGGDAAQFGKYRETYRAMVEADSEKNEALYARRDEILDGNPALTKAEALERAEMDLGYKVQNSALKWAQQITRDTSLTDAQKADLILMSDISASSVDDIKDLTSFGVPVTDYVDIMTTLAELGMSIGDEKVTSEVKKQLSQQIYETKLTAEQKTALARKTIGDDWIVDYTDPAAHELALIGKSAYNDWKEAEAAYNVPAREYLKIKQAGEIKGDKDENGDSIDGSKKCKVANLLESLNVSDEYKQYLWSKVYGYESDVWGGSRIYSIKKVNGVWVPD